MSGSDVIAKNKRVPIKREETSMYLSEYKITPAIKKNTIYFSVIVGMNSSQGAGFKVNFSSCQLYFGKVF